VLNPEDLPGTRMVALSRVSDPHKNSGVSLDRQDNYLLPEIENLEENHDGELITSYKVSESASTMDRESLQEILEMAQNDEFDILMVWAVHRLTRANPWDTFEYLLKLREEGIIIYSDRDGYFDWEDPDDAYRLTDRVTTSREWRNSIERGTIENNRIHMIEGRWPYGALPYGADKEQYPNDHDIVIKDGYGWVYEDVFERYLDGESEADISDSIENMIDQRGSDIDPPSKSQVENVLENELFLGRLILSRTGEVVRTQSDLKQVDEDIFERVSVS